MTTYLDKDGIHFSKLADVVGMQLTGVWWSATADATYCVLFFGASLSGDVVACCIFSEGEDISWLEEVNHLPLHVDLSDALVKHDVLTEGQVKRWIEARESERLGKLNQKFREERWHDYRELYNEFGGKDPEVCKP